MSKYKKVRCIALNIKPGTREKSGSLVYLGSKSAELDIQNRCKIMKYAIATAYDELTQLLEGQQGQDRRKMIARGSSNTIVSNPVLTIFMAPEFFFRGADGAYPVEKISSILPEMGKMGQDSKFKDWLFVYGTAIGYRKVDEILTKVLAYDDAAGKSQIVVDSLPENPKYSTWEVEEFVNSTVQKVERIDPDSVRLTMDSKESLDWCSQVTLIHGKENERTEEFDILDSSWDGHTATITVRQRSTPIEKGWAAELSDPPASTQEVESDDFAGTMQADVAAFEYAGDGTAHVTLNTQVPIGEQRNVQFTRTDATQTKTHTIQGWRKDGANNTVIMIKSANTRRLAKCPEAGCNCTAFVPQGLDPQKCNTCMHYHVMDPIEVGWEAVLDQRMLTLTDRSAAYTPGRLLRLRRKPDDAHTEVFNMALVQRGGAGAREILVTKQKYSNLDFLDETVIDPITKKRVLAGKGRFMIHGEARELDHTEKMAEGEKSVASDMSGDPVFDIDGCTIGTEVCLDHYRRRLEKYYAGPAAGKPKPQVLLIPSWGMSIGGGPVCSEVNGVAFNVDGSRGDSVVRIIDGAYGCDNHLDQHPAGPGICPDCNLYYCPRCDKNIRATERTKAGTCPKCKGAVQDAYFCPFHKAFVPGPGSCPLDKGGGVACNAGLLKYEKPFELIGTAVLPEVESATVKMPTLSWDWLTVMQKSYFLGKGSIAIYPELPIPKA
jgi:hypothetical protein